MSGEAERTALYRIRGEASPAAAAEAAGGMTSDPLVSATAESLHLALERRFAVAQVNGIGSPAVTNFPFAAADVAMALVGPVLEARDAEIAALEAAVPASDETAGRWRAALGGDSGMARLKSGSEEEGPRT